MTLLSALVLCIAAVGAGAMNALAGGGSFVTFPALLFTGLDPRAANITSTIALFPGQIVTGWAGRRLVSGAGGLSFIALFVISLVGGVLGAFLLLATPASFFARLVPWLVLFATGVFTWGSFFRRTPAQAMALPRPVAAGLQLMIAIYGGYFGGGIGFLMLAVLTAVGLAVRNAGATKNVLASCMNAAAAVVFVFAPGVGWLQVVILSAGSAVGGWIGAWLLQRVNEKLLRIFVITVGAALTVGLFLRG